MLSFSPMSAATFHKTLVIDIETVPVAYSWNNLTEGLKKHWIHKMQFLSLNVEEQNDPEMCFQKRAGIYSEFGKVVCIGLGLFSGEMDQPQLRLKSIQSDSEPTLLLEFSKMLDAFLKINKGIIFCGHNIKEFDIPFLCRRFLINDLPLPECLQFAGLKPWQVPLEDTLNLWRFGDFKNYTSLDLLAEILGIPSSKSDLDGSRVASVYWLEKDLPRIAQYCLRDVYTTALVYLKLKNWRGGAPDAVYV
jgi:hypothetical protein